MTIPTYEVFKDIEAEGQRAIPKDWHTPLAPVAGGTPVLSSEQAKAVVATKVHPRVSDESITEKIAKVTYYEVDGTGTLCVITMKNGWQSTGFSKPADARNYDRDVGRRYAYDQAYKPLWQLEGYLLRDALHKQSNVE